MSQTISRPDPSKAAQPSDLIEYLRQLRTWAGGTSFREIQRRIKHSRRQRQHSDAPPSLGTVHSYFQEGRDRFDIVVITEIAMALGIPKDELQKLRQTCRAVLDSISRSHIVSTQADIPRPVGAFTGREAERNKITELVRRGAIDSALTVVIEGMAGVGKTELALRMAADLRGSGKGQDAQLFVGLRGYDAFEPAADPDAVVRGFLKHLGVAPHLIDGLTPSTRVRRLRDELAGKDVIMVLDNAANAEQVQSLLPGTPTCTVIVTSRKKLTGLDDATRLNLDVLSTEDSIELLRQFDPGDRVDADPKSAAVIVELCRRLPIELAAVGGQLANRPDWTLDDHLQRVIKIPPGEVSRPAFAASYEQQSAEAKRLFRMLALHPGNGYGVDTVSVLVDRPAETCQNLLAKLSDEHLLMPRSHGRVEFHDAIRDYAQLLLHDGEPLSHQNMAVDRLITYYRSRLDEDEITDAAWLELERSNLMESIYLSASGISRAQLALALQAQLRRLGYYDDVRACCQQALNLFESVNDLAGAVEARRCLAVIHQMTGDLTTAATLYEEAMALQKQLGDDTGFAHSLFGLAQTSATAGDFTSAVKRYHEALDLHRKLGNRDGEAEALLGLAAIYRATGEYESADRDYRQVLEICRSGRNPTDKAFALCGLAIVALKTGMLKEALSHSRAALEIFDEQSHRRGHVYTRLVQADIALAQEDIDSAGELALEALAMGRRIGNRNDEGWASYHLGKITETNGQLDEARQYYGTAHDICNAVNNKMGVAHALRGLGNVASKVGDLQGARRLWTQSLRSYETLQMPQAQSVREDIEKLEDRQS